MTDPRAVTVMLATKESHEVVFQHDGVPSNYDVHIRTILRYYRNSVVMRISVIFQGTLRMIMHLR